MHFYTNDRYVFARVGGRAEDFVEALRRRLQQEMPGASYVTARSLGSIVAELVTWDYDRAVVALRRFLPSALGAEDPAPHRDIVFAVHASEITGRCSVSSAQPASVALVGSL